MQPNRPNRPNRIEKLSPLLINQLAAGEVVTRPASVVKELLENAIDAGADVIEIRITQGGMGMIEVVDNGQGILPEDMSMAVTRHATSKVADVANLHGITTLGFRGEALASIVAVSRVCIISSADDTGVGRRLLVTGVIGDTPDIVPCVYQRGTQVTVKDLYFNVPARRANLKNIATEYQHIETVVKGIATAYPAMTLRLYHDGKCRQQLQAVTLTCHQKHTDNQKHINCLSPMIDEHQQGTLFTAFTAYLTRLQQVLDLSWARLLPFYHPLSSYLPRLSKNTDESSYLVGWLWQSTTAKCERLIYVNHRLIKLPSISQQIRQTLTAQGVDAESISYAVYFVLPSELCHVNVHPSKQTIHIQALSVINTHLHDCLSKCLNQLDKTQLCQPQPHKQHSNKQHSRKPSIQPKQQPNTTSDIPPQSAPQSALEQTRTLISQPAQSSYFKSSNFSKSYDKRPSGMAQVNSPHAIYQLSHVSDSPINSHYSANLNYSVNFNPLNTDDDPIALSVIYRLSASLLSHLVINRVWRLIDCSWQNQMNHSLLFINDKRLRLPTEHVPWQLLWHQQTLILTQNCHDSQSLIARLTGEATLHQLLIQNTVH